MNNLFNNNQTDIDYSNIKELVRNYQPLDVQYLLTHDKPINLEIKPLTDEQIIMSAIRSHTGFWLMGGMERYCNVFDNVVNELKNKGLLNYESANKIEQMIEIEMKEKGIKTPITNDYRIASLEAIRGILNREIKTKEGLELIL